MNSSPLLPAFCSQLPAAIQRYLACLLLGCCSMAHGGDNAISQPGGRSDDVVVNAAGNANQTGGLAQPIVARQGAGKSRAKAKPGLLPSFVELRNPVALLVAAKNRLWSTSRFRLTDSVSELGLLGATDVAPIDVTFGVMRPYLLSSPASSTMTQISHAIDPDLHPGLEFGSTPSLVRSSAAQLNMRVNSAVSLLWEVDRSDSVVDGSEVGVGMGFKVAF
jgi:hypothetical protein